jgi:hypothetical protein
VKLQRPNWSRAAGIALAILLMALFTLALLSESPARILVGSDQWTIHGEAGSKVLPKEFPPASRHVRDSVLLSDGPLFRTWTPEHGLTPIEATSGLFVPTPYMAVLITGSSRTSKGSVQAFIECGQSMERLEIFRGSVNTNLTEALIHAPSNWCPSGARVKLSSQENEENVGLGSIYGISLLSYLKSSFVGRLPYFAIALVIFSAVLLAGASMAVSLDLHRALVFPSGICVLGAVSLVTFYAMTAVRKSSISPLFYLSFIVGAVGVMFLWSGRQACREALRQLRPLGKAWFVSSFIYFCLLGLATNGLSHWEPNYRFWPATWSSDNELPWLFAEAVRHNWDLRGLFGGTWLPTDRPPLMAGAYLLLSDVFGLLQYWNDGNYLTGPAYNAAAILLNALWVPAAFWLLRIICVKEDARGDTAIVVLVGALPFSLFNTIYGWPKAFGAAFALVAFGLAWLVHERRRERLATPSIILFFALAAFSVLAHASTALFLAPLGLLLLHWSARIHWRAVTAGSLFAIVLIASWGVYKSIILPSADPVLRYALTGDYGFDQTHVPIWRMFAERYAHLSLWQWLEVKRTMLLQAFLPVDHFVTQVGLNADAGATALDKLRAWDALLISKGNAFIPFAMVLAIWMAARNFYAPRTRASHADMAATTLIGLSSVSWLLIVFIFLAPPIIPHWPQAALFGLALGGATILRNRFPRLFRLAFVCSLTYTGLVWLVSPLQSALTVDYGAGLALVLLACLYYASRANVAFSRMQGAVK